ncbi:phage holin family protein [Neisseriaceae bacterium TC5R-5]|nr:phage holin family protein [Neisseriaceae bacterium TC5R-5]
MSEKPSSPRPGSLRSFAGGLFALLQTRAQLLSLEAQELKHELLINLLLAVLAFLLLLLGLVAGLLLIWALTPADMRAWVMGGIAMLLIASSLLLIQQLLRRQRQKQAAFAMTREEVRKDWAALRRKESL